jgi:hypothetical protein
MILSREDVLELLADELSRLSLWQLADIWKLLCRSEAKVVLGSRGAVIGLDVERSKDDPVIGLDVERSKNDRPRRGSRRAAIGPDVQDSKPDRPSQEVPISDRARELLGYQPDLPVLIKIGRRAAALYRQRHGKEPGKVRQSINGTARNVNCYDPEDFDIMDEAIRVVVAKTSRKDVGETVSRPNCTQREVVKAAL